MKNRRATGMAFVLHINGNESNLTIRDLMNQGRFVEASDLHVQDQTFKLINYLSHLMSINDKIDLFARI